MKRSYGRDIIDELHADEEYWTRLSHLFALRCCPRHVKSNRYVIVRENIFSHSKTVRRFNFHSAGMRLPDWLSLQFNMRVVKSEEF
jgi:hypothetical protein